MNSFAPKIKKQIEESGSIKSKLKMSEQEIKKHIKQLKQEVFKDKIALLS